MEQETRTCGDCGSALPPTSDACPACLLRLGLAAPEENTQPSAPIHELQHLFPHLEILELLGEGGMGTVYRARQRKLQRLVALKILSRELSSDPAFAERFLREAQALARLQHPNIVSLFDFGETDGAYFLVMEYVDGLNLRQLLLNGELKPSEALAIVPQICDGLQYAHTAGVIHRDIKPENVLVDRSGKVKIADFGLAKILDQAGPSLTLTGRGQVMGTPQYMAPEQLANSRNVDHRADIYSLGVVLYELLTGNLPRGRFDLPSRTLAVDVRLDEVVLRALEQEPARRYQHVSEMKTDVSIVNAVSPAPGLPGWRSALRTFLSFAAVWMLAGFAFNAGPVALAGAGIVFVAVGLVEARRHFTVPRGVSAWRGALGSVAAAALLAASFAFFFITAVNGWERSTAGYVSSLQEPAELLRVAEDSADELLAGKGSAALVSLDVNDWPKIHRTRHLWIAAALCLALAMAIYAGAAGALPSLRRLGPPLAGVCVPAFLAFVAANGVITMPRWLAPTTTLAPLESTTEVTGEVSAVADKLYLAVLESGAIVDTRLRWSVGATDDARPAFDMHLLSGQPESPFDRWKLTWVGPRRTFPHLVLTLVGPTSGNKTVVKIDGGRGNLDGDEGARWLRLVKDLLARAGPSER